MSKEQPNLAADFAAAPGEAGCREADREGLVSLVTSVPQSDGLVLENIASRLARMRSSIRTAARLHCESMDARKCRYRVHMQTLTYRNVGEWQPHHISDYVRVMRKHFAKAGVTFRYAWVAELQRRGAVHYHVLLWLPLKTAVPHADKRGFWPHGSTNTKEVYAPVKYAIKYTSKGTTEGSLFPSGLRAHASGGLDKTARRLRSWWVKPRWVRNATNEGEHVRPCIGGGWMRESGEWLESPWVVIGISRTGVRVQERYRFEEKARCDVGRRQ